MSYVDSQYLSPAPRILLVDDTELNREIIGGILESAGYTVDLASDGEQACAATWSKAYDLVLMDLRMPQMDGLQALSAIRSRSDAKGRMPVVIVPADTAPDLLASCLDQGADDLIRKPVEMNALFDAIGRIIARQAAQI